MQFAWRTAIGCFLCGLLVGSFYANLVFTHTEKATRVQKWTAVVQHHVNTDGIETGLIVGHSTTPPPLPPPPPPPPTTKRSTDILRSHPLL
eukprot:m.266250 g.266250  ORF g.266250 m.266250 type:complete len:91 (-) comp26765_c3_seq1:594-866(-)